MNGAKIQRVKKMKKQTENKNSGLTLNMDFDEAMRRVSKIKPAKKPAKRKK